MKKFDNTKFEGVRLQDEGTPFAVRDLHHKGVKLVSNLGTIPRVFFHSYVWLRLVRHSHMQCHQFKEKQIFDKNQLGDECVKDLVPRDV